jgi:predicted solute-binding protein
VVKYIKIVREYKISLKDLDCDKVRKLEDRYRNAIAHAHNDKKEIDVYLLTGSDESANISLQYSLSSIRFIIKVQINSLNEIFNFVKNKSCEKSLKRKC